MKKILQIRRTPTNKYGGISNYCIALQKMFQNDEDFNVLDVEDYPILKSRLFHFYYRIKPLYKAIKKADIIHINGYTEIGNTQAFIIAKLLKKKIVYTAHWHPFKYLNNPKGGKCFFYTLIKPFVKHLAHAVVTINNEDTAFFNSFCRNVHQIPHWYDFDNNSPAISKKGNMIMFVGRLSDPVKGLEHIMHLPEGKYDIHLVGSGEKPNRTDCTQHCNVPQKELERLYKEASLLVIPSRYEAFSYAAIEALSHGTPVVMSERVRIADYLSGVSGYSVFKFKDYEDFNQKVEITIGTSVDIQSVRKIFSTSSIKKEYKKVYSNL